jgi:hypothetical protein
MEFGILPKQIVVGKSRGNELLPTNHTITGLIDFSEGPKNTQKQS